MLEFKIWLNNFLANHGAVTVNQKSIITVMMIVCVVLFFYVLLFWLFKWRLFNKKYKKMIVVEEKKRDFIKQIYNGGYYAGDFDTSISIRVTPYKKISK